MQIKKLLAIVALVALAISCKKKPVNTDNIYKFRDYISYTTSGLVSIADPIRINLSEPVEAWNEEQEIDANIVTVKPHVQGKLKALNKHTLVFTPDEYLEPSTEYTVNVKLGEIYKSIPSDYEDYTFQFKTITPSFNIVTNDLQSYSKEWQYLSAQLRSADIIYHHPSPRPAVF